MNDTAVLSGLSGQGPDQSTLRHADLPLRDQPQSEAEWIAEWPVIEDQLQACPTILVALGFDGILSPTVPRPSDATLPESTRALLQKLSYSPRVTLAFLSGRPLHDIQQRIRLSGVYYVGNHGMEIRGPGFSSSDGLAVSCRSDLVDALAFLARWTKRLRGIYIEDKGLTVTAHWRLADPAEGTTLKALLDVFIQSHPRLRIFPGETCWELRARASWNKGDALHQILERLRLTPSDTIYIGESFTDGDAFDQMAAGLTFCVANTESTRARYRLARPVDVETLLQRILESVERRHPDASRSDHASRHASDAH